MPYELGQYPGRLPRPTGARMMAAMLLHSRRAASAAAALRSALRAILSFALLITATPATTAANDPLDVVRAFCREDGAGKRISPATWRSSMALLVAWPLEPAWDRLSLVRGYEIKGPRHLGSRTEVEVAYSVVADVSAAGIERAQREVTIVLELISDFNGRWMISGAPHPPHIFEHVADLDTLAELLAPDSPYESNSEFVWRILQSSGFELPYTQTGEIPVSPHFEEVGTAAAGDIIVYFGQGVPYHVGWMQSEESVLSATLNAGRQALPFSAFAGSIRYWRPRRAEPATPRKRGTPSPSPLRRR